MRVRLGSLEPDLLSEETITRLAAQEKLCPQFHLSLQSGCDRTLARMNRKYTAAEYATTAQKLCAAFDRPTFTTDVIVGFPGEAESDFNESLAFVRDFGFLKVHVFPYSVRPGTKAAGFHNMVDKDIKTERCAAIGEAAEHSRAEVMRSFVGAHERAIAEQKTAAGFTGYTDRYLPAIIKGAGIATGDVVCASIEKIDGGKAIISNKTV